MSKQVASFIAGGIIAFAVCLLGFLLGLGFWAAGHIVTGGFSTIITRVY